MFEHDLLEPSEAVAIDNSLQPPGNLVEIKVVRDGENLSEIDEEHTDGGVFPAGAELATAFDAGGRREILKRRVSSVRA